MAIHWLILLPLLIVLLLGPLVLVIALLSHRKTRTATAVVLTLLVAGACALVLSFRFSNINATRSAYNQTLSQLRQRAAVREIVKPTPKPAPNSLDAYAKKNAQAQANNADAQFRLGVTAARRGYPDEAVRYYRKALTLRPKWADAHCQLAAVLADQKRWKEAVAEYQAALKLKPDDADSRAGLEKALAQQKATPAEKPAAAPNRDYVQQGAALAAAVNKSAAANKPAAAVKDAPQKTPPAVAETEINAAQPAASNTATTPGKAGQRPDWIDAAPQFINETTYQMAIMVGPYTTPLECDARLPDAVREMLRQYIEIVLGTDAVGNLWRFDDNFCRSLVMARWEETKDMSVGRMTQLHAKLQILEHQKQQILETCRRGMIEQRLAAVGMWFGVGLAALAVCYGLLRLTGGNKRDDRGFGAPTGDPVAS